MDAMLNSQMGFFSPIALTGLHFLRIPNSSGILKLCHKMRDKSFSPRKNININTNHTFLNIKYYDKDRCYDYRCFS